MGKSSGGQIQVTEYYMSMHLGICLELDVLQEIYIGEKLAWSGACSVEASLLIHKPDLFGGAKKEGGVSGLAYYLPGGPDQVLPESLAERMGLTSETCPGYRGIASIFFVGNPQTVGWIPTPGSAGFGGGGATPEEWLPPGGNPHVEPGIGMETL